MKKAKTNKKIFTIFSAILGVVFAFITGFTYCSTSLNLIYGTKDNSTSAYMGNQQYHIINDTIKNPVMFGDGAHNFDIALQYSFDYDFDLRVKYSLSWSNGKSTDNVILNFANRDNIIYDENYIYLANAVEAGSGKVSLIVGVDFVDPTDKTYDGAKLTINLGSQNDDGIRIHKTLTSYSKVPFLVKDVVTADSNGNISAYASVAAQTWLQYKQNITAEDKATNNAYAMVYNYRRDFKHGLQYPGPATAYKKPVAIESAGGYVADHVYASEWTGGNRGYAGTGMYVIAGGTNLDLEVQVAGIWRTEGAAQLTSENNIQYNYSNDWNFARYSEVTQGDDTGLWEVRTFTFYVEANTACYIDILDSVEITSAGINTTTSYRLVTNSIVVNSTTFAYGENSKAEQFKPIISTSSSKAENLKYKQESISIINTTKYNNGLYDSLDAQQKFNGNISLINNLETTQKISIVYDLKYHISNGRKNLYDPNDATKKRAIDLIEREQNQYSYQSAFSSLEEYKAVNTIYYSYTGTSTVHLSSVDNKPVVEEGGGAKVFEITIAPYSSVNLISSYEVGSGLASTILNLFDTSTIDKSLSDENLVDDNRNDYYDVWTYIEPAVAYEEVTTAPNLTFETTPTTGGTKISIKNNTNFTITGVNITDFSLQHYIETKSTTITSEPHDWEASYWKYIPVGSNDPLTSKPNSFSNTGYYYYSKGYEDFKFVEETETTEANFELGTGFSFGRKGQNELDSTKLFDTDIVLLPGESVKILTVYTTGTSGKFITNGTISTTSTSEETDVTIINNGTEEAYIVNYSDNAYYLKLSGKHSGKNFTTYEVEEGQPEDNFTYYIGIVRPGQIIELTMEEEGTISTITLNKTVDNGDFDKTKLTGWSANAVLDMEEYFNINKNIT